VAESIKTPACNAWRGAMCPQFHRPDLYNPKKLEAVSQAFDAIWNVLRADDPFRDYEMDRELRTAVGRKLTALVTDGVTDPVQLRKLTIESLLWLAPLRAG
jgi:hypothetical protein